ncbi:zinc finger, C2H2 type [Cooperia oncophora]
MMAMMNHYLQSRLGRHEARLHGERAAPSVFVCQHCNKVYNAHSQLREHIDVVHENLRPFKCEQCGMEFGRAGGLRRHDMMVHQQKKHACPYEGCNHPGYKCTKALAAHIRSVHTLDRPFACLFCERTFVRKNDLKVHELTHSTQCEFICKKCNNCELCEHIVVQY